MNTELANYTADANQPMRTDIAPLEITQPEGVGFIDRRPRADVAEVAIPHQLPPARGPGAARRRVPGRRRSTARCCTAPRWPRWSCPTATRRRSTSGAAHSTPASSASASSPTRCAWAATASARSSTSTRVIAGEDGEPTVIENADLHPRGGRRHPLEAHRLGDRQGRRAALAPTGGQLHRHGRQLPLRLLLELLPGRVDPG